MEKLLTDTLTLLGLSEKEIRFMRASYRIGPATINEITKNARLERSTAYFVVNSLLEKELLREDFKPYRKNLTAVEPKTLLRLLAAKQRTIRRQEMEFEERLGELQSYYSTSSVLPKIHMFQGKSALLAIWNDVLATNKEILLWTNQKTESLFFSKALHEKFITERIRKQIPIRVLAVNNQPGKKLLIRDASSFRHSKLLPIQTSFHAETYIYENKVAMLDYTIDTIGIIIESEAICATQRAIFAMTWNQIP